MPAPLPYVIAPAGVTPASFFTPSVFVSAARPPAILADNIDPATGDFKSLLQRIHPVDAAIIEAFRLQRGSGAAVLDAGQTFKKIRKNNDQTPRELKDEATRVMQIFVDRGDVAIITIETDTELFHDLAAVLIKYTNLRTGQAQRVPVP
jgi:hypothetical protein